MHKNLRGVLLLSVLACASCGSSAPADGTSGNGALTRIASEVERVGVACRASMAEERTGAGASWVKEVDIRRTAIKNVLTIARSDGPSRRTATVVAGALARPLPPNSDERQTLRAALNELSAEAGWQGEAAELLAMQYDFDSGVIDRKGLRDRATRRLPTVTARVDNGDPEFALYRTAAIYPVRAPMRVNYLMLLASTEATLAAEAQQPYEQAICYYEMIVNEFPDSELAATARRKLAAIRAMIRLVPKGGQ
jgi:hypothetical protein